MNIIELLELGQGLSAVDRETKWVDLGVDLPLIEHMHMCYDYEGNLTNSFGAEVQITLADLTPGAIVRYELPGGEQQYGQVQTIHDSENVAVRNLNGDYVNMPRHELAVVDMGALE